MKNFLYQAYNEKGQLTTGEVRAESEPEVLATLVHRNLTPTSIEEKQESTGFFSGKSIKRQDLIDFTNGLGTLVEASVPIDKALGLLEGMTDKSAMQQLIAGLRQDVKEGKSLSQSMESNPSVFSRMYVSLIKAGEEGGILEALLPQISKFLTEAEDTKRHIISSLIYPLILLIVGLLSVVLLLVLVVPRLAGMFQDADAAIPDSAAFLMALSGWLQSYGWLLVLVPFLAGYAWKQLSSTATGLYKRDAFLLDIPVLGTLLAHADLAHLCRTMGMLLSSGVPLLKSLGIARTVVSNMVLSTRLGEAEKSVRAGVSLGKALSSSGKFPLLMTQLVIVGEESGRTAEILLKLSATYDRDVRQKLSRLVSLLEPVLILLMGVMVGSIVVIMLSAIFSINDLAI